MGNYKRIDAAREKAFRDLFDGIDSTSFMTATCLVTRIESRICQYFLPDHRFQFALSLLYTKSLTREQEAAFRLLMDGVLTTIEDLEKDGSAARSLIADASAQLVTDFALWSQFSRLGLSRSLR